MNIGINTRFLHASKMEGFGWYTFEITKRLVLQHPEHTFYFFFDRKFDEKFVFAPNVIPIVLFPPARHPFLFFWYFEFSITKALKKYNIDLFFSPDGYLSLRTKVPEIAVIHDINFEHFPNDLPKLASIYLRYFFPKFARKATHIITVSEYSKMDIVSTYACKKEKVTAIWNGASSIFKPISSMEKQKTKEIFSGNQDYFLFVGSLHPRKNIKKLIEAYILYKNKYPKGYNLVIVGDFLWNSLRDNFSIPEKFKENILLTGHLDIIDLANITASASCLTYVPYFEGFGIPLVESMKCGVPIICGNLTSLPEIVGEAALLVDPHNIVEISDAMENLYLNVELQQKLKELSLNRAKLFSWDISASKVWEVLAQNLKQ